MFNAPLAEQHRKLFFPDRQTLGRYCLASGYRLDLFSTGEGGFAACLRYGPPGDTRLLVYDGGSAETGKQIVDHLRRHGGDPVIDDLVCSQPGGEQCLGLFPILENLEVRQFWMHRPWLYSDAMSQHLHGRCGGDMALARHVGNTAGLSFMLESLARRRKVPVAEPFQGAQIGPMRVMSPHRDWYIHRLVPGFMVPPAEMSRRTPEFSRLLERIGVPCGRPCSPDVESLDESGECRPEMESSVVLYGLIGGEGILLTGNAGLGSLTNAAVYAEHLGIRVSEQLKFFQVPASGDANHLSPSILDRLIGAARPPSEKPPHLSAFLPPPSGRPELPHRAVVHALAERGAQIVRGKNHIREERFSSARGASHG